jgi:16S rRNA (cytidine1402-2'-O)-methyltransferase
MASTLYLIPSTLGESAPIDTVPAATLDVLRRLERLIVETPKQARRFLKAADIGLANHQISFDVLDEHTPAGRLPELLAPALAGADIGILSDAGCPGIADPGARLVMLAHSRSLRVIPLVGPSAILLALMGSGLNGQRFAFHGYLPIEAKQRDRALQTLERESKALDQTQIVIEAPYRNNRLLQALLQSCAAQTRLCIATDLTLPSQYIATRRIEDWRGSHPDLDRRPTVFVFGA